MSWEMIKLGLVWLYCGLVISFLLVCILVDCRFLHYQYRQMYFFPSVPWRCWLDDRKGIWPVKKLGVDLLMMTIWLELCTSYSSSYHYQNGDFLVILVSARITAGLVPLVLRRAPLDAVKKWVW